MKYQGNMLFVTAYRLSSAGDVAAAVEIINSAAQDGDLPPSNGALLLNNLGSAEMARKNWSAASSFLSEAVSLKRTLGNSHSLGLSCANLGFVNLELGNFLIGTQLVIEGAQHVAKSPFPESNAQLVANFMLYLSKAPNEQREKMEEMWSTAGMYEVNWPPTTITYRLG